MESNPKYLSSSNSSSWTFRCSTSDDNSSTSFQYTTHAGLMVSYLRCMQNFFLHSMFRNSRFMRTKDCFLCWIMCSREFFLGIEQYTPNKPFAEANVILWISLIIILNMFTLETKPFLKVLCFVGPPFEGSVQWTAKIDRGRVIICLRHHSPTLSS